VIGKVNDDFFRRAILPHTGASQPEVVTGPRMGVDAALLRIGDLYMAVAEDPVFPGSATDPETFGWITVHIGASDVAVTGIMPRFMTYSLLLPPGTPESYIERTVKSISETARELGISIVGGHTGYYTAVSVPTIGGITVWGFGKEAVTAAGARPGDKVIITKGAAVETAAILADEAGEWLKSRGVQPALVERARARIREMTVVEDARIAMSVGGVRAMHDATEGGVARGLWEIADASGVGMRIDRSRVPVPEDIAAICSVTGLDPLEVISEGTLLITCAAEKAEEIVAALEARQIPAAIIGDVVDKSQGCLWVEKDGTTRPILPPPVDRFWEVLAEVLERPEGPMTPAERQLCAELEQALTALQTPEVAALIPEVGANIAYALPGATRFEEIAAVPGRLHNVQGKVVHMRRPAMAASRHMGTTLLHIRSFFPEARCVINLRNQPVVREALSRLPWRVVSMPTPEGYRQTHDDYVRDLQATLQGCQELPDVIEIPDRLNLERLILVLADSLPALVEKVTTLAREVNTLQ